MILINCKGYVVNRTHYLVIDSVAAGAKYCVLTLISLQFTDVSGSLNHGCTVTTREVFNHSDARDVSSAVVLARVWRRSAAAIARWWIKQYRRPGRSRSAPSFHSKTKGNRAHSMVEKASNMKWGRKVGDDEVNWPNDERKTVAGLRAAVDKVMSKNRFKSSSVGDITFDATIDYSDHSHAEDERSPIPEHIRLLGISAYQAMIEAEKEGDVCIVERSYVLTGTKLQDTSLFFCALQNLIDMERKVRGRIYLSPTLNLMHFHGIMMNSVLLSHSFSSKRNQYP